MHLPIYPHTLPYAINIHVLYDKHKMGSVFWMTNNNGTVFSNRLPTVIAKTIKSGMFSWRLCRSAVCSEIDTKRDSKTLYNVHDITATGTYPNRIIQEYTHTHHRCCCSSFHIRQLYLSCARERATEFTLLFISLLLLHELRHLDLYNSSKQEICLSFRRSLQSVRSAFISAAIYWSFFICFRQHPLCAELPTMGFRYEQVGSGLVSRFREI